jgi:hypothetical protein
MQAGQMALGQACGLHQAVCVLSARSPSRTSTLHVGSKAVWVVCVWVRACMRLYLCGERE